MAQVQVQRLFVLVVQAIAEIQRPQRRFVTQEHARRIDVAAVEGIVVVPYPAALQRGAEVEREIQRQERARRHAPVVHHPPEADVLPGQGVLAEARQLLRAAQLEAGGDDLRVVQGAPVTPTDNQAMRTRAEGLVEVDLPLSVAVVGTEAGVVLAQFQADLLALVGKVHVVQGVESVLQLVIALGKAELRLIALTDTHLGITPGLADTEAQLAVVGDLPAEVEPIAIALHPVFGDRIVVQHGFEVPGLGMQVGRHEPARADVERLVELAEQLLAIAQLHPGEPLRAKAVDTVLAKARAQVEDAVAIEIVGEVEPQAQVVGTGALFPGIDHQGVALIAVDHPVLHALEVIEAIQGAHVALQLGHVQRLADGLADVVADHLVADLGVVINLDGMDHRGPLLGAACQGQRGVATAARYQLREARLQRTGGLVAGVDHFLAATKIGDCEPRHVRLYQHVAVAQRGQLLLGIAPGHHGDRLVEHVDHGEQFLAWFQRCADIDDDHPIHTHFPGHVDGDVVDHAAVDE